MINKQATLIEWRIAEDDAEWERLCPQAGVDSTPAVRSRLFTKSFLCNLSLLLLFIASVRGWQWYAARAESERLKVAVAARVAFEIEAATQGKPKVVAALSDGQAPIAWKKHFAQEAKRLYAAGQTGALQVDSPVTLQDFDQQGEQVVTTILLAAQDGKPAYRQTRFYRQQVDGRWLRIAPVAARWGAEQELTSTYFTFYFRQRDAQVVAAAAPQIDALYATMRRNLGLTGAINPAKVSVEVSVLALPGDDAFRLRHADRFVVPSPALYLAPVDVTDAEILVQSLAFPLFDDLLAQALTQQPIRPGWQPMLGGLRLWQLWALDLPLATWQEEVVKWIYVDLPTDDPAQPVTMPSHYTALCAAHTLWMPYPERIQIPLLCDAGEQTQWYWDWVYSRQPPVTLAQLATPLKFDTTTSPAYQTDRISFPGRAIALATLVEYAVENYGAERLPALLHGLGQSDSWETLLPAVYGVSPAEFVAGWQRYLATHYGVVIPAD